jgi:hypothetical protein
VAVVLLLFNASVIWEPFGGWTPGPRYAVPAIPFLILLCAAALARWRAARLLLVGGGLTGLLYNGLAAAVDVHVPEEVGTPLTHYLLPLARHGCLRGAGALALLVVLVGLVLVAASLVRRPSQGATRPQSSRPAAWVLCAVLLAACWGCLLRPVNTAWGRYHLGCALLECGDPGEAELRLRESVADDPDLQPAHSLLGRLYASQGDTAAATRHLTRALELRGSDEEARRALQALQAPAPESRP